MSTVSAFLDELSTAAGGADALRDMIARAAEREKISQPSLPMWKRRGIPWSLHPALHQVCEQLGVQPNPKVWRATA